MRTAATIVAATGFAAWLAACGSSSADPTVLAVTDPGDGGPDAEGGADVVVVPDGCDLTKDAKDAPRCVVNEVGVFVDGAGGSDVNAGTKESPVKSIGAALAKLGGKTRVYVCEGTYEESVKLASAVSVYGGFVCAGWSHAGGKSSVAPKEPGKYALEVAGASGAVLLEDLAFTAAAGTAAAPSSIAGFVNASAQVALRRVALVAGKGFAGKSPAKAADGALASSMPTASTLNGNSGGGTAGGLAQLCTCVGGGTSKGGGGGSLNSNGSPGETAQAIEAPAGANGDGQTSGQCAIGGSGTRGSDAPNAPGADGAKRLGELTATGWAPEPGKNATAGTAGQGGGGGGGAGGGGGGGACGGCGGSAGQGGGGGGASIALLSFNSPVVLAKCTLTTSDAGAGGAGGAGGEGIAGGTRGTGGGTSCNGGNGGKGGNGGAGGGGAGGISIGVLYKGPKPTLDAAVTTGAKGGPGPGAAANDGIDGQKAEILELQ